MNKTMKSPVFWGVIVGVGLTLAFLINFGAAPWPLVAVWAAHLLVGCAVAIGITVDKANGGHYEGTGRSREWVAYTPPCRAAKYFVSFFVGGGCTFLGCAIYAIIKGS